MLLYPVLTEILIILLCLKIILKTSGVMGGQMGNTGMVGMGNQMVPPYGAAMAGQMGNMGMGGQVIIFN